MLKEIEEPFEKDQIGSSAMAYKRNPMRSEGLCSLARYLSSVNQPAINTYAAQWFERILDDSACRRIYVPEMFLTTDACMIILDNIFSGLVVYPSVIRKNLECELSFLASEDILMALVRTGVSRQEAHEHIHRRSHEAAAMVKEKGQPNDLVERIRADPFFAPVKDQLNKLLDPENYIGRSKELTNEVIDGEVEEALAPYQSDIVNGGIAELHV